jgi:hypothetical protein
MPDDGYRSMQIGRDTAETRKAAVAGELGPRSVSDGAIQRLGCFVAYAPRNDMHSQPDESRSPGIGMNRIPGACRFELGCGEMEHSAQGPEFSHKRNLQQGASVTPRRGGGALPPTDIARGRQ